MHNIGKLVRENKAEAIDIIKAFGGEISFIGGKAPEGNEWLDGVDKKALPWVIVYDCELIDMAVLAVRLNESGEIEFYGFDTKVPEASDWREVSECANGTENEIYEFIGNHNNNER